MHDFVIPGLGKAFPYGVYDIAANAGWVNLGITHDTAAFAVESIRRWWHELGAARYPAATRLLITADCGGGNGVHVRLWKRELQVLADGLGIAITVRHLPPSTSRWNRIEHRLFAFITQNWRGKPLVSHQVIVQLIANTRTNTGLTGACRIDANDYDKGIRVSDAEMAASTCEPMASIASGTTSLHKNNQKDDAIIVAQTLTPTDAPRVAAPERIDRGQQSWFPAACRPGNPHRRLRVRWFVRESRSHNRID